MKNKKNVVLLFVLFALIITILILLIINNGNDKDNSIDVNKELVVECSNSATYDNYVQTFKIELYNGTNAMYLIQKLIMEPKIQLDVEVAESVLYALNNKLKTQFETTFKNNKYIDYEVYMSGNQYISEISYVMNNENKDEMEIILGYDYIDNSLEDIILNIENGGLKCIKQ